MKPGLHVTTHVCHYPVGFPARQPLTIKRKNMEGESRLLPP